jgi:hypothetical protein
MEIEAAVCFPEYQLLASRVGKRGMVAEALLRQSVSRTASHFIGFDHCASCTAPRTFYGAFEVHTIPARREPYNKPGLG